MNPRRFTRRSAPRVRACELETLESRQLLAGTPGPNPIPIPVPGSTTYVPQDGLTPAQVRHAYGFDQVKFGNITGDGSGQTIALIDAQDNPTIQADLANFDSQFGLPAPPSFRVVSQRGGSDLPAEDPGWAGEIALDVEWAHAVAPMANILLVETDTQDFSNLIAGVDYARHQPGVSVISMSFGGNEFFQYNGGEGDQRQYGPIFNTPQGHQGVTFVAAAGDHSAQAGVLFPAAIPNVLSVGGTRLNLADQAGTYGNESYWSGTNSGYSNLEPEPVYQEGVQGTGFRSAPDVTYNADPATGVAVYSQDAFGGWNPTGGTSAGSPQWAALIAIADQGRAMKGLGTLDGPTQTLPILYSLYASPFLSPAGYAKYTTYFNDINQVPSSTGTTPGGDAIPVAGFDTPTGLGSPKAAALIPALASLSAPPASPLSAVVVKGIPASATGGTLGVLKLRITNTGASLFDQRVSMNLGAATATSVGITPLGTVSFGMLRLKPGASKVETVRFEYPPNLASGSYRVTGSIFTPDDNLAPASVTLSPALVVAPPTVDLAVSSANGLPVVVRPGKTGAVSVVVRNVGNTLASGFLDLRFYASADGVLDSSDTLLPSNPSYRIRIAPGASRVFRVPVYFPTNKVPGSYSILASIMSNTNPLDANTLNNVAVLKTTV